MTSSPEGPTERFRSLDQKPFESHYFYVETVIDHPVAKVWPQALRIESWMTDHRLETLSGTPGKVGHFERVYMREIAPTIPAPHYHLYGISEVIPLKCIALEVFPEKGGSYGNTREWMAFDSLLFTDIIDRTRVAFLQVHVNMGGEQKEDAAARQQRMKDEAVGRDRLERYFGNLKRLVALTA